MQIEKIIYMLGHVSGVAYGGATPEPTNNPLAIVVFGVIRKIHVTHNMNTNSLLFRSNGDLSAS